MAHARPPASTAATVIEDHPLIPTQSDVGPSLLLLRAGMLGEPVDPERFADEMLALVDAAVPG